MPQLLEIISSGQVFGANLYQYFKGGGVIMYPLLCVAVYMWTLIFERIFAFHRLEFKDIDMADLLQGYRDGQVFPAKTGLRAQIRFFLSQHQTEDCDLNKRLLDQCCLQLRPGIDRNIMLIAVLAMVSPLLGLLGTVTGMITTFDVIAMFGTGNARALAGGISEALITTQSGLLVSIPGVFASAVLTLRARRLQMRLDESMTTLKRIV